MLEWTDPIARKAIRRERLLADQAARRMERRIAAGFEPLKITARLQTPVISDAALPIDAVLYYVWHREQFGRQDLAVPGASSHSASEMASELLPLERRNTHCPEWFYAASWAQWGTVTEGMDHWNCRFDTGLTDFLEMPRAKLDIASGRYKSYHMPVYSRHAISAVWYAVGHAENIQRLLRFATNIGKKTSQGYGAVLDWTVEPIPDDLSVRDQHGMAMRAIPSATGTRWIGYRPSYWLPAHQCACEIPS